MVFDKGGESMEKLAFLFTGQGSQYIGMAKSLYDEHEIVRQTFEEANDVLGFDVGKLCFEGSLTDLTKTENTQPALLTVGMAYFRAYMKEVGIAPHFLAGHSLGEYTALTCAGVWKFADALEIVRERGQLTKEIVESDVGAMTIVDGIDKELVEIEAKKISDDTEHVQVNCYNAPTQVSIAGNKNKVEELEARLLEMDAQISPLLMSAPFHTTLMESVSEKLKDKIDQYPRYNFRYPVISNCSGAFFDDKSTIPEMMAKQATQPVQWEETMNVLERYGVTHAIELGPKNVLCNLVKLNSGDAIEDLCYANREDKRRVLDIFPADHHLKRHIPTVITKCLAAAVATPNENEDREEFQKGVKEPYRKISHIQEELDQSGSKPSLEQMKEALELLKTVFDTKRVSKEEQDEWFHHILHETGTYYSLNKFLESNKELHV